MADFTLNKPAIGDTYIVNSIETSFGRLEPLLTPDDLVNRYLFGIPLVSQIRDPFTGKAAVMTKEAVEAQILVAVNQAEIESSIVIMDTQIDEWQPFDRNAYEAFGYFVLRKKPVNAVQSLKIVSSDNSEIFDVPLQWLSVNYPELGQIGILPLTIATTATGLQTSPGAGGSLFLSILGQRPFISAFWRVKYAAGFPDNRLPVIVNNLIGCIAAIRILGMLGATYAKSTGANLSIDNLSQGISGPGPNIYQIRIKELTDEKNGLIGKLKAMYGQKLSSGIV